MKILIHKLRLVFFCIVFVGVIVLAGNAVGASPMTAVTADNKYTINYEWLTTGGNKYLDFSIRNNDSTYNPGTSADDFYFSSAFGLNNSSPPGNWTGYEISNGDGSEKIGYNTNDMFSEIFSGETRNYSQNVDSSYNLNDLTSGFMLDICADGCGNYRTQANLNAPREVINGPTVVPEPVSSILFLAGAGVLAGRRFLRRKKAA